MKTMIGLVLCSLLAAAGATADPAYDADGKMLFPKDYRTWVFLSSGFDMSYSENIPSSHVFDNVFVERPAYDAFLKTGAWPDKTVFMLEQHATGTETPPNKHGFFQSGAPIGREVHVKDAARGGWAFYGFGKGEDAAAMIPKTANCYSCHEQNAQTDTTFTQFYPELARKR